jgi:hypothetical protein
VGKLKENQFGFGAIELLLGLIFLAIVAFIGVYVAHNHNTNKTTANVTANKTSTVSTPTKTASTVHTPQEAVSFTQTTYNDYLAAINNAGTDNSQPLGLVGLAAVKENLTSDFYGQATASQNGSAFSCAEQFEPSSYTASLGSSTGTSATVDLTISNSGDDSTTTSGMTASVNLTSLKITAVTCPN